MSHNWKFSLLNCEVRFATSALSKMSAFAQGYAPKETGGTLVGHYSTDRSLAFVDDVLQSRTEARRGTFSFYRPSDDEDDQLSVLERESGGRCYYLGEWHSHPSVRPVASGTDTKTVVALARSQSVATCTPLLVILGLDLNPMPENIACYVVTDSARVIRGRRVQVVRGPNTKRIRK